MTASSGSKAVTPVVESRLVERFEHLSHGLLHHAVDHVGNTEPSLLPACLRDPHAPNVSGAIAPSQQIEGQPGQNLIEMRAHRVDALAVWAGGSFVRCHLLEG
jgi:hypothetical protein